MTTLSEEEILLSKLGDFVKEMEKYTELNLSDNESTDYESCDESDSDKPTADEEAQMIEDNKILAMVMENLLKEKTEEGSKKDTNTYGSETFLNSELKDMNFKVGDEGAKAFSKLDLKNLKLEDHIQIGDEGAKALSKLNPKNLKIEVPDNQIGDEGIKALFNLYPQNNID